MVSAAVSRFRVGSPDGSVQRGTRKARPSAAMYLIIGLPILLGLTLIWQLGSMIFHVDFGARDPVAVSSVILEADPIGARLDFTVVDRAGEETTVNGDINISVREPDGALWNSTRHVSSSDFGPLLDGGLLDGRTGYSVVIPASDWARAPRRGGTAVATVSIARPDADPISVVADVRFP